MELFSPDEALNRIISLVDAKYQPYLRTGATSVKEVVDSYRSPQGVVPEFVEALPQAEIDELVRIRNSVLSGDNLAQTAQSLRNFVPSGVRRAASMSQIREALDGVRYVEPAGATDPMGRDQEPAPTVPATAGMAEELRAGYTAALAEGRDAEEIIQRYIDRQYELRGLPAEEARAEFEQAMGVAPVEPSGGAGEEPSAEADTGVPEDFEAAAAQIYGGYYAIVKQNQEIASLLLLATEQGWDESKFKYELEQTNWWKDTTGAAREFSIREQRDPATVATEINNKAAELQAFGVQVGLTPGSVDYNQIARDSLRFGWGDQVTQNALNYRATQSVAGRYSLLNGYYGDKVRDLMRDYGQSLPNETLQVYVNDLATGAQSLETLKLEAEEAAKAMFPSIADRIARGQTVTQIAQPYRNTAASILEVDPNSIDFTSSEWAKAFTVQNADGSQRTMNFNEWGDYLRTNRQFGYEYTTQAKQRAYQVANQLADLFGKA